MIILKQIRNKYVANPQGSYEIYQHVKNLEQQSPLNRKQDNNIIII